jgi:uncharacterized membrane protein YgcG
MLSATQNGESVPFHTSEQGGYVGIAVGRADVFIPKGEHTYVLKYVTDNHIRFFEEHAEIYYNGIGFESVFPVDRASVRLVLPDGAEPSRVTAFTGKMGETGRDFLYANGVFATTRTLEPSEGLTTVIAFDKNLVTLPAPSLPNLLGANRALVLGGILGILILYFGAAFYKYRAELSRITVIPLFSPPDDMSPGYMAKLKAKDASSLMFLTDMVWLAVNGYLRIRPQGKDGAILQAVTRDRPPRKAWVTAQCDAIFHSLFGQGDKQETILDFDNPDDTKRLEKTYTMLVKKYGHGFYLHTSYPSVGLIGAALFIGLMICVTPFVSMQTLDGSWGSGWASTLSYHLMLVFACVLVVLVPLALRNIRHLSQGLLGRIGWALGLLLLAGVLIALIFELMDSDRLFISVYGLGLVIIWFCGKRFLNIRTQEGRRIDAQVQGLEMYIRTAEQHRLAEINAPEDTIEKYEEILPYAIALGCADAWQKRFGPLLNSLKYQLEWSEFPAEKTVDFSTIHLLTSPSFRALAAIADTAEAAAAATAAAEAARRAAARRESSGGGSSGGYSSGSSGFGGGGSAGRGSGGGGVGGW